MNETLKAHLAFIGMLPIYATAFITGFGFELIACYGAGGDGPLYAGIHMLIFFISFGICFFLLPYWKWSWKHVSKFWGEWINKEL